jgi:hypothetical protein
MAEAAVVVVREGPASERGWLGLRLALALGLGGHPVSVVLSGEGAGWAVAVDARGWLGGDPGRDLAGLVDDAGARLLADGGWLTEAGLGETALHPHVEVVTRETVLAMLVAARLVVPV